MVLASRRPNTLQRHSGGGMVRSHRCVEPKPGKPAHARYCHRCVEQDARTIELAVDDRVTAESQRHSWQRRQTQHSRQRMRRGTPPSIKRTIAGDGPAGRPSCGSTQYRRDRAISPLSVGPDKHPRYSSRSPTVSSRVCSFCGMCSRETSKRCSSQLSHGE